MPGEFPLAIVRHNSFAGLKIIVAITGASGALYAQRLLDNLDPRPHDIHVVITSYGYAVIAGDDAADFDVLEEVTAGRLASAQVSPGTAVRIMTGGTLPHGADAVIMVEETTV